MLVACMWPHEIFYYQIANMAIVIPAANLMTIMNQIPKEIWQFVWIEYETLKSSLEITQVEWLVQ